MTRRNARQTAAKVPPGNEQSPHEVREGSATLTATVPLRIRSAANLREHWAVRAKRVKQERMAATLAVRAAWRASGASLVYPIPVRLVRIVGPRGRTLDGDNLQSAMKAVRDSVADVLDVDDGNPHQATWEYSEERGKDWGVRVEIRSAKP